MISFIIFNGFSLTKLLRNYSTDREQIAQISYLERRGAVYYARVDIPTDLVSHYGTTCRKKSLKAKDLSEAKRAVRAVIGA